MQFIDFIRVGGDESSSGKGSTNCNVRILLQRYYTLVTVK